MAALPQHMQALGRANDIRIRRSALKHEVSDGTRTASSVVLDPPEEALTMSIYDLLAAQNRWGRTRALRLLRVAQVKEGRQLGELTPRQRGVLVALIDRCWEQS